MNLSIVHKLLLVSALPIIALLFFSVHHVLERFQVISIQDKQLVYTNYLRHASSLIHSLQLERGLGSGYVYNQKNKEYFKKRYLEQIKTTDSEIENFEKSISSQKNNNLSFQQNKLLKTLNDKLRTISNIRTSIMKNEQTEYSTNHAYYTALINSLLNFGKEFNLHSTTFYIDRYLSILQQLMLLKEYAGQERALVATYANFFYIPVEDIHKFHVLLSKENEKLEYINFLAQNTDFENKFDKIKNKYENSYFTQTRDEIQNHQEQKFLLNQIFKEISYGGIVHNIVIYQRSKEKKNLLQATKQKKNFDKSIEQYINLCQTRSLEYETALKLKKSIDTIFLNPKKRFDEYAILSLYNTLETHKIDIDSKKWFEISSERINSFKVLECQLADSIEKSILHSQKKFENDLFYQVLFTLSVILLLLIATIYTANKIRKSLKLLDNGLENFFDFLNFRNEVPKTIVIDSNDEISSMAENINQQIEKLQENIQLDQDFINETTQIVMLMKDGDFSERSYFVPWNPHLKELKDVFNELADLIADKIKEQTKSLEALNSSLEEKVFHQTNELYNQVQELTIARDKAIRAEVAKDEFLANMSHEIRTPLNAILGFVTILKKRIKEEKSLNYLNIIDTSGKSLLTIINDILDFSKIQSGKFQISPKPIQTIEELSNATILFASKAYEKHIVYAVYLDPKLPQSIKVDEVRVKQILSNLLSNAIKFTREDGEVHVKISIENSKLVISVQDSGIGISKENQSKVFSAFEQADGSTTRKYGGTGLGLSISAKLAHLMNGYLTLESEINVGSTFTLTIPVEIVDSTPKLFIEKEKIEHIRFAILNKYDFCLPQASLVRQYLED